MMLDNKKNKAIKSHLEIFRTYKELKNILPFGYIKTRISPAQKYSFKKQSILINLEKEKNKEISPTKITKNLLTNKNIYIFSDENDKTKKIISTIKKYYSYKKPRKILSIKSETNINSDIQKVSENNSKLSRNNTSLNNYIINANTINCKNKNNKLDIFKGNNQSEDDKNKSELNPFSHNIRKCFRSSSINNCIMKNNIYLPSITNRLKTNLPRYERQNDGFLVNGLGQKVMKELNINTNNNDNNLNEKMKNMKNKSTLSYVQSYENKNDNINIYNNIIIKSKKHKSHLYKKKISIDECNIEIMGIKKINK